MEQTQVSAETLGGSVPDFTVWGMFWEAGIVVQLVIVLLVLASVWTWAIIFEKMVRIRKVNSEADAFEETFWSGNSLESLYGETKKNPTHPLALVFISAMREWQRSLTAEGRVLDKLSLQERIAKVMRVTSQREMERLEERTVFLATVGSTAPFVGLFGTVWGIMNAFQSIALTSNTSLAVVAPGIAEALLATALGLVAAIPAVMAYNKLSGELARYAARLEGFSDEFQAVLSRQMDQRAH
ncbi:MAG: protein TolQ [Proteobacteria bacterium]|nr:protein TolQ [Pseudomonadota bacterium]